MTAATWGTAKRGDCVPSEGHTPPNCCCESDWQQPGDPTGIPWHCTRLRDHDGQHVATGLRYADGEQVMAVWPAS